jgi:hypothetical protein
MPSVLVARSLAEEAHGGIEHPLRTEQAESSERSVASNAVRCVILDDLEERIFHRATGKFFVVQESARSAADRLRAVTERLEELCLE